jgi:hypothetical protein
MKNGIYTILCITLCSTFISSNAVTHAITYKLNGGRFGDNLHTLTHALWLSYTQGLRMFFQPFQYSEYLKVHHTYQHHTHRTANAYKQHIIVRGDSTPLKGLNIQKKPSLYITTYVESPGLEPWSHDDFVETLRTLIAPTHDWNYPPLPENMHTIALHVRRGGNADTNHTRTGRPFQFPDIDYYARALQMLLHHLDGPCYVHLFTDDFNPARVAHDIMTQCSPENRERVTIQWRKEGNRNDAHVVEDFFDMMRFEYLIRARSNFSLYVERLGTCKVAIVPTQAETGTPWGIITEASINIYGDAPSRTKAVTQKVISFTRSLPKEECQKLFATS